jgi:hypothetical protein
VVDRLEEPLRLVAGRDRRRPVHERLARREARQERTVVPGAVDQGVAGLAVRRDRGDPHRAVLVGHLVRLLQPVRALRHSVPVRLVHVGHLQRDVGDPVAVLGVVLGRPRCLRAPSR